MSFLTIPEHLDSGPPCKEFIGEMKSGCGTILYGQVAGSYRWLEVESLRAKIEGSIRVDEGYRHGWFDPFRRFKDVLCHRKLRLIIPGVGVSCIALKGTRAPHGPSFLEFRAYAPPIVGVSRKKLAEALETPIADALEEAGHPDLAAYARASAVALVGFKSTNSYPRPVVEDSTP